MATLYWGGGTGNWDGFTVTGWYTDFARVTPSTRAPSAEDDVIFDSVSNATGYTITILSNTTVCRSCTISGPASGTLTLAGAGVNWYIYGSLTFPATGFTYTFTGGIFIYGTGSQTITTNGVALGNTLTFAGTGTYTLQDALNNSTAPINLNAGTFNTNGMNLTCGTITATPGTTAGTLTLGSSTVSAQTISANAPLVINAGTSNITLSNLPAAIGGGTNYTGNTFYNVTLSSSTITLSNFYGNNTFNNLTYTTRSTTGVSFVMLYGNQTVTGTFTIAGQSSVNRYLVQSNLIGTPRTLTVGTVASLTDVDFRDITVAGASSPWSGTRLGDCGGNTNITFPAAKTVYWNRTVGGAWSGNFWATGSGGSVSTANFPLAQDTAIIDNTGLNTGSSITGIDQYQLKTLTSTKTNAYTLSGTSLYLYGDLTLTASTTLSAFQAIFAGRVTQNLRSAGNSIGTIACNSFSASLVFSDSISVNNLIITSGGLNTNNKTVTVGTGVTVSNTNTGPFTLTLGSSAVSISNTGFSDSSGTAPTMTVSAGTSTITFSYNRANFGFVGQTLTWNNVTWSTAIQTPVIYGNNTFNNLTFTSPTTTGVILLPIYGNQTVTGTLALGGGISATQRMGVVSDTAGTQRTLTVATVSGLSDIDFRDIAVAGASAPWSGTRLGNCLGNSGITFSAAKTVYWNLLGTNNWSATAWATSSGGTPAANNFPLAQDTAIIDNTNSSLSIVLEAAWNIGTINASARTTTMQMVASAAVPIIYGNITYGSGITSNFSGGWTFQGTSTQTLTTAGRSLANSIVVNNPSCVFQHGDACTTTGSITVTRGSYATQNYNVTCVFLSSAGTTTRSINLGTSTVTVSGGSPVIFTVPTGLTFTGTSSTINLSNTAAKTFAGGGQTFGTVSSTNGTTGALTITGSNTFGTLTNSARTYMIWTSGTTQTITNFTYSGASGSVVRWYTSILGQRATIKQSSTGGSLAAVGTNSTDGGNNSGLTFTGSSPNYFYVKDIAYLASYNGAPNFFSFF